MAKIPNVPMTMTIMRKSVSAMPAPNLPPRAEPAKYGVGVSPKGMKPASAYAAPEVNSASAKPRPTP